MNSLLKWEKQHIYCYEIENYAFCNLSFDKNFLEAFLAFIFTNCGEKRKVKLCQRRTKLN